MKGTMYSFFSKAPKASGAGAKSTPKAAKPLAKPLAKSAGAKKASPAKKTPLSTGSKSKALPRTVKEPVAARDEEELSDAADAVDEEGTGRGLSEGASSCGLSEGASSFGRKKLKLATPSPQVRAPRALGRGRRWEGRRRVRGRVL